MYDEYLFSNIKQTQNILCSSISDSAYGLATTNVTNNGIPFHSGALRSQ